MTVGAKTEELENKVPLQEEEEEEEEEEPGVTPGEGKLLGFGTACFSIHPGFREQAAQRKRSSPRRRKRPSLTLRG